MAASGSLQHTSYRFSLTGGVENPVAISKRLDARLVGSGLLLIQAVGPHHLAISADFHCWRKPKSPDMCMQYK